mgnify:CR=1 FL=1
MIELTDFLRTQNFSDDDIGNMFGLLHTETQKTAKKVGRPFCAYDLWRSDSDNQNHDKKNPNLNTDWEYYNRTHGRPGGHAFLSIGENLLCFVEIPISKEHLFTGLYKVIDKFDVRGKPHPLQGWIMKNVDEYVLKYDKRLREFEGKLILGGWKPTPNIKRNLNKYNGKYFIKAILNDAPEEVFSYQEFIWSSKRISKLPSSWQNHLSQLSGIYLLVDTKGNQYIGSASSAEGGFLSRWKQYEKSGHGGNKQLRKLKKDQQVYTVSILETAPSSYSRDQVIKLESIWKNKLGTRAHGLNLN